MSKKKVNPERRSDIEHDARRDAKTGNYNPPHKGIIFEEKIFESETERQERGIYKKEHRRHKKK